MYNTYRGERGTITLFITYVVLKIRENNAEVKWKYLSYPIKYSYHFNWSECIYEKGF